VARPSASKSLKGTRELLWGRTFTSNVGDGSKPSAVTRIEIGVEIFPVAGDETEHVGIKGLMRRADIGMGQRDALEGIVVKARLLGPRKVFGNKYPVNRKIQFLARGSIEAADFCPQENR
jgi:hypothetical protein